MASRRTARVGEQLRREISDLLQREVKDPRVEGAIITHVDVTADLFHARVFVSVGGDDAYRARVLEGLVAAAPFIRGELGRRLHLRRVPELRFELDRSLDHALRIEQLLREVMPSPDGVGGSGESGESDEGGEDANGEDTGREGA